MPETNRLQTCMARKELGRGSERDLSLLELYVPSRNTGQGDCCHGKLNLLQRECEGKPNLRIFSLLKKEAMDLKGSQVMAVRLETGRSIPG